VAEIEFGLKSLRESDAFETKTSDGVSILDAVKAATSSASRVGLGVRWKLMSGEEAEQLAYQKDEQGQIDADIMCRVEILTGISSRVHRHIARGVDVISNYVGDLPTGKVPLQATKPGVIMQPTSCARPNISIRGGGGKQGKEGLPRESLALFTPSIEHEGNCFKLVKHVSHEHKRDLLFHQEVEGQPGACFILVLPADKIDFLCSSLTTNFRASTHTKEHAVAEIRTEFGGDPYDAIDIRFYELMRSLIKRDSTEVRIPLSACDDECATTLKDDDDFNWKILPGGSGTRSHISGTSDTYEEWSHAFDVSFFMVNASVKIPITIVVRLCCSAGITLKSDEIIEFHYRSGPSELSRSSTFSLATIKTERRFPAFHAKAYAVGSSLLASNPSRSLASLSHALSIPGTQQRASTVSFLSSARAGEWINQAMTERGLGTFSRGLGVSMSGTFELTFDSENLVVAGPYPSSLSVTVLRTSDLTWGLTPDAADRFLASKNSQSQLERLACAIVQGMKPSPLREMMIPDPYKAIHLMLTVLGIGIKTDSTLVHLPILEFMNDLLLNQDDEISAGMALMYTTQSGGMYRGTVIRTDGDLLYMSGKNMEVCVTRESAIKDILSLLQDPKKRKRAKDLCDRGIIMIASRYGLLASDPDTGSAIGSHSANMISLKLFKPPVAISLGGMVGVNRVFRETTEVKFMVYRNIPENFILKMLQARNMTWESMLGVKYHGTTVLGVMSVLPVAVRKDADVMPPMWVIPRRGPILDLSPIADRLVTMAQDASLDPGENIAVVMGVSWYVMVSRSVQAGRPGAFLVTHGPGVIESRIRPSEAHLAANSMIPRTTKARHMRYPSTAQAAGFVSSFMGSS